MSKAPSCEALIAEYLANEACSSSGTASSRCISFAGFPAAVVEHTIKLLPDAEIVKVDPVYADSLPSVPKSCFLNPKSESFTTFRNVREGLAVLFPSSMRGEERESTASIACIEPEDVRARISDLVDYIPEVDVLFGEDYEGFKHFLTLVVEVAHPSLEEAVTYALEVCRLRSEGETSSLALGAALPFLGAFRWEDAFRTCKLKSFVSRRWRSAIEKAVVKGREYALKRSPTGSFFSPEDLSRNLDNVADLLSEGTVAILRDFIAAPVDDSRVLTRALQLDWKKDGVELLFKGSMRTRFKLGEATRIHLQSTLPGGELDPEDVRLLDDLDQQRGLFEEDRERLLDFYGKYRAEIGQSKRLANRWERELYPKAVEELDFLLALAKTATRLVEDVEPDQVADLVMVVRPQPSAQDMLETLSRDAFYYFVIRYRGIQELLSPVIDFKFGALDQVMRYDLAGDSDLVPETLQGLLKGFQEEERQSKSANRLVFRAYFEHRNKRGTGPHLGAERVFTWTFPHTSFLSGLRHDMQIHAEHPLRAYRVPRALASSKGTAPPIALDEIRCVEGYSSRGHGRLVSEGQASPEVIDLRAEVISRLRQFVDEGLMNGSVFNTLCNHIGELEGLLRDGMNSFLEQGLAWPGWQKFADRYGDLLHVLASYSTGERYNQQVLNPLTLTGFVFITSGPHEVVVCTPLHPLRLIALYVKSHQMAQEVCRRLQGNAAFIDVNLHDTALELDSSHPYYPEVLAHNGVLLVETASIGEYSLMQSLDAQADITSNSDDPAGPARVLEGVVKDYLVLHPHEKVNLSVLLHAIGVVAHALWPPLAHIAWPPEGGEEAA